MWKHDYLSAEMTFDENQNYVSGFLYHSYEVYKKGELVYKHVMSKLSWDHADKSLIEMLKLAAMPGSTRTEKIILGMKVVTVDVRRDRF